MMFHTRVCWKMTQVSLKFRMSYNKHDAIVGVCFCMGIVCHANEATRNIREGHLLILMSPLRETFQGFLFLFRFF